MYLYASAGFVLLFGGGELLVRGAISVAERFGLSPLLIGMTIVAFCTSAPELVVSVSAAMAGSSAIAVGNVVGSNIFNIIGVLGVSALIAPIAVSPAELRRDSSVMVTASIALVIVALSGSIGFATGFVLFFGILLYVVFSYRAELRRPDCPSAELHEHEAQEIEGPRSLWLGVAYLVAGLAALVLGSRFLIDGATDIARTFGVAEAVIGLTLVAVGTSLPELATSIVAALRGHADVAVGNVVGSNIFNILSILGITAMIRPIEVSERIATVDVWVMLGVSVLLSALLLTRGRLNRITGAAFLAGYVFYVVALFA
jgi:cation:H+ antiporter